MTCAGETAQDIRQVEGIGSPWGWARGSERSVGEGDVYNRRGLRMVVLKRAGRIEGKEEAAQRTITTSGKGV